jgi:FtsZ-binding cell division protein ZapB
MSEDNHRAEIIEMQVRLSDLQNSNERLREERDAARASVDLLLHENHALTEMSKQLHGWLDRLRIAVAQGVEL